MSSEKQSLKWSIITLLQRSAFYLQYPLQPIFDRLCRRQGIYRKSAVRNLQSDDFADTRLINLIADAIDDSTEVMFALGELGHRFIDNPKILGAIQDANERNGAVTTIIHGPRIDPETKKIFDLARKGSVKLYSLAQYPTGHFGLFKRNSGLMSLYDEEPHSEVLWKRDSSGNPKKLHSSRYRARYFRRFSVGLANARNEEFKRRLTRATSTSLDPRTRPGYEHSYKYPFLRTLFFGARNFFYWVAIEPIEILSDRKLTILSAFATLVSTMSTHERTPDLIKGEEIRGQIRSALQKVIQSSDNTDLLDRFKQAYEYRKQFPWLGESGQIPDDQDGVAYALRESLASYIPEALEAVSTKTDTKRPQTDQTRRGNGWKKKVTQSVELALADPIRLQQFADSISEFDEESIQSHQIEEHVVEALEQYYKQHKLNTSSDPW